jgi:glycosyltransferase involved in cell wall biosynthesis
MVAEIVENGRGQVAAESRPAGPAVSVIMPAYNASAYIREAIDSVLAQRFTDFELLVVDDGSSDDTPRILEAYRDPRIRVIRQANQGQSVARNRGLEASRGEFIAFLDADDLWDEGKLALQIHLFQDQEVGLAYTGVQDIDEKGRFIRGPEAWAFHRGWILERLLLGNFICCSSVLLRKRLLEENRLRFVVGQDCEDWLLWCQVSMASKADYVPASLVQYRVHAQGWSRNRGRMVVGEMACRRDMAALLQATPSLPGQDVRALLRLARLAVHNSAYSSARRALREGNPEEARKHWNEAMRYLPPRIGHAWRVATFPLKIFRYRILRRDPHKAT